MTCCRPGGCINKVMGLTFFWIAEVLVYQEKDRQSWKLSCLMIFS